MLEQLIASFESNIRHFASPEFWIGLAVIAAIAVWTFYKMLRCYNAGHMMAIVPTAKIRSAAQGYVELIGQSKLMDGPLVISPLSRTVCVWYRYKIEEKVRKHGDSGGSHWRTAESRTSDDIFLLEDDTGRCIIDPDDADVIVADKRTWYKHHVNPPRRYTEELITENEPLYVIGLFTTMGAIDDRRFSQQVSDILRQWKNDPNQLLHDFDTDGDKQISPKEWEQARLKAERQLRLQQGQKEQQTELNVMKASRHKDQRYILSTIPEHKLISRYYRNALAAMIGFLISSGIVVWAMNARFGTY